MEKRILILGASGMLGHDLFRYFSRNTNYLTYGTVRKKTNLPSDIERSENIIEGVDAFSFETIKNVFNTVRPDIVVNCIGIIKQLKSATDPIVAITINSLLPHQLAQLSKEHDSRLIHISTDCVFSGTKGMYTEQDQSDCDDLYGKSKFLGEVHYPQSFTFRTSIIGHEINTSLSLVDWFLAQSGAVKGFKKAVFSGFPTIEIARVIDEFVIPHPELSGLYQVSAEPINKYDLLKLISSIYGKEIDIIPDDIVKIDRSLDSTRFRESTGYFPPSWEKLIQSMYNNHIKQG